MTGSEFFEGSYVFGGRGLKRHVRVSHSNCRSICILVMPPLGKTGWSKNRYPTKPFGGNCCIRALKPDKNEIVSVKWHETNWQVVREPHVCQSKLRVRKPGRQTVRGKRVQPIFR